MDSNGRMPNRKGDTTMEEKQIVRDGKNPLLVFLFSLIPGAGHMYLGLMTRGLHLMGLFFGMLYVSSFPGLGDLWPLAVAPILWFYSFFDSLHTWGSLNRGEPVYDKGIFTEAQVSNQTTWGILLVIVGGLLLLNNLVPLSPSIVFWARRISPPVVLISLGCYLLWRPKRAKSDPEMRDLTRRQERKPRETEGGARFESCQGDTNGALLGSTDQKGSVKN